MITPWRPLTNEYGVYLPAYDSVLCPFAFGNASGFLSGTSIRFKIDQSDTILCQWKSTVPVTPENVYDYSFICIFLFTLTYHNHDKNISLLRDIKFVFFIHLTTRIVGHYINLLCSSFAISSRDGYTGNLRKIKYCCGIPCNSHEVNQYLWLHEFWKLDK